MVYHYENKFGVYFLPLCYYHSLKSRFFPNGTFWKLELVPTQATHVVEYDLPKYWYVRVLDDELEIVPLFGLGAT